MVDVVSQSKRSEMMSKIKASNTSIEVSVRKWLFARGFRFRKNDKRFPGKPDIVLPKYKAIVFVHGCFWHGHAGCRRSNTPKSNSAYWEDKIKKNIARDKLTTQKLIDLGWNVIVVYECELEDDMESRLLRLMLEIMVQ